VTTVAVLGAGAWGTTFAKVLADGGADVRLWARRDEISREINETHRNTKYLQRVTLPLSVTASTSLTDTLDGIDEVYLSVPSQVLRSVLEDVAGQLGDTVPVVSLMKGVERSTGFRMSQVIREVTGIDESRIAVVSGPNLALEIAKEEPTASAVSSTNLETAVKIAATCHNDYFTTLTNTDVIGTEFGGVLKNLIAVAVGIADGVGYGDNTKASIITRGLAELSAFASAYIAGYVLDTLQSRDALVMIVTDSGLKSDSVSVQQGLSAATLALKAVRDLGWALAVGCLGVGLAVFLRSRRQKAS
jgi:glycerol-3-phosphate dehydrogenase (NAD(P)+)